MQKHHWLTPWALILNLIWLWPCLSYFRWDLSLVGFCTGFWPLLKVLDIPQINWFWILFKQVLVPPRLSVRTRFNSRSLVVLINIYLVLESFVTLRQNSTRFLESKSILSFSKTKNAGGEPLLGIAIACIFRFVTISNLLTFFFYSFPNQFPAGNWSIELCSMISLCALRFWFSRRLKYSPL